MFFYDRNQKTAEQYVQSAKEMATTKTVYLYKLSFKFKGKIITFK